MLGLANVFLKPLVTFIALPLILLTFGIAYFFVNVVMLLFTEWVTPDFSIDGFWTYVGATIVIWLVNWIVWTLVDVVAERQALRAPATDWRVRILLKTPSRRPRPK